VTLVIGRIAGPRVAIASDTMLTEHGMALPFQRGVIKSCMLPGDICVSFSNSPVTAARAFTEFAERYPAGARFADVVSFFEHSSGVTGNDYLIAFSYPARLVKITDGKRVHSRSKTQWVGDHAAYSAFRRHEGKDKPRPQRGRAINAALFADELPNSPASDLFSTMRNVVADPSITSAGGFVSVISNRDNGFRYSVYSDMLYDWPSGKAEDYELAYSDDIAFTATGENVSFTMAQVAPGYMGLNAVAFYLRKALKLFLFYGSGIGLADKCQVFSDVPPGSIYETLNTHFNVNLRWLLLVTSPQNISGKVDTSKLEGSGTRFEFFVDANTLPPASSETPPPLTPFV
jgi:hypothetical protein